MNKITVAIPAYGYLGNGASILKYSFFQMSNQTFKDFDVVVSDHSIDNDIKDLCLKWDNKLDIKYYRNTADRGSAAANTSNSIKKSTGIIIKLLCCDDFLLGNDSLQIIFNNFDNDTNFLATGYLHTIDRIRFYNPHYPQMNEMIHVVNTIGTPSCVAIRNYSDIPELDKKLTYCYDEDFYKMYIDKYGGYKLINDITVANYLWNQSISSKISNELIEKESKYILKKHENKST